jgi:hypothetical protein
MASPLNNVDKITIVSTGPNDGRGAGANQLTADIARMVAQVPELFETLTGVKVGDLMSHVTGLGALGSANGNGVAATSNGTTAPAASATTNGTSADGAKRQVIEGTATPVPPKSDGQ